jgi:hypothetical protein
MKIYKIAERKYGKTLREQGINHSVVIYRGVDALVPEIKNMDYVTMSLKFATEHAEHMMWTEESDTHVLRALAEPEFVADASNTGEYFYIGETPLRSKIIKTFKFENYQ